jgi:hypothetical protein
MFYTEDAKKYGLNSIFRHILPDLKLLETSGVCLRGTEKIFGSICCLVHDNLGGNSLLGFMESFNSSYYCQICSTSKEDAQTIFEHNEMVIRNKLNYAEHLRTKTFGVQTECELNQLKYFNFLDSPTVDIMHDLLEGVVPYELKLVLQKLISIKCFTLETLNNRLISHNFGFLESKNRPSPIRLDMQGNKIGQKAAQAWCLIRFLPIIIGDLIVSNEGLKYWELVLQLLECMSFIFSRKFSESTIIAMHSAIISHHKLFLELFPEKRLIPKHHFMCHYSYIVRQSGPLVSLWTMRFEGKHNYFAQIANHNRNFKNICYSLSMRHQQFASHNFKNFERHDNFTTGEIYSSRLSQFLESFEVIEELRQFYEYADCTLDTNILTTDRITLRGYKYKMNNIVCFKLGSIFPQFGIIINFLLMSESTCLVFLKELTVEYFDRHLFSYKVILDKDIFRIVDLNNLFIHDCFEMQNNSMLDGTYIVTRHCL